VVVLIGSETADRKLVQYEIKKAWEEGKGLLGIYIHNIKCPRNSKDKKGKNPFERFYVNVKQLSEIVECYNPNTSDTFIFLDC
ncbi:MAG: TIR domain-containing protein, partial [Deltaproteobacteria bacterium]|nr:TIR domain-containing protein [Deltaproteobacteria bacterium]